MIKIVFPAGCYGNYLARCIYTYTNLRQEKFIPPEFDKNGSSHADQTKNNLHKFIKIGHLNELQSNPGDIIISVLPDDDHNLDYYNNQFFKHQKGQILEFIKTKLDEKQISEKLKIHWNYQGRFNDSIPHWMLREWCSFWLTDSWNDSYSVKNYSSISNSILVNTTQLVENFETVFYKLISDLKLTLTVDLDIINQTHSKFVIKQRFHNSQIRCQQWVNKVLDTTESTEITIDTIFDEAYIQYLLRARGFEIECHGLNQFPSRSDELKKIIYQL